MKSPDVYIVIVNYQQWRDTIACVSSVLESQHSNFRTIVVDNKSPNNSGEQLISEFKQLATLFHRTFGILEKQDVARLADFAKQPDLTFIQNDSNAGFAAANNLVLEVLRSTDSYIWLLNPDIIVNKDTLPLLLEDAQRRSPDAIIGTLTKSFDDQQQILFYGGGKVNFMTATVSMIKRSSEINQLDYVSGSSLFTHARNFSNVGLLPEDYFLYWEETDWCYQATRRGIELHVCSSAICYDKISTSIGKEFLADYYYTRNGLQFVSKYRKKNIPFVLLFMAFRFLKRVLNGRPQSARGVYRGVIDFFKSVTYEIQ